MLAMVAQAPRAFRQPASSLTTFASKPAPTENQDQKPSTAPCRSHDPTGAADCPVGRLRSGSAQWATRHGCRVSRPRPRMADGGGPTERDRSEGTRSASEGPYVRGVAFWLLWRDKVTRRKGGTLSGGYRRNGDVHRKDAIAGKPAPTE